MAPDTKEQLVRNIGHTGAVALVVAGLVLGAGCGGGSTTSSNASANPASDAARGDASSTDSGDTPDDTPGDSGIPEIADATWSNGRIHVEVSGDSSAAFESDGSGATLDGVTSAAFAQNEGKLVSIGLGGGEESAIALTVDGVSTVGGFDTDCDITFTKNETSGLAADFTCNDLEAINGADVSTIDVKGNFTLSP